MQWFQEVEGRGMAPQARVNNILKMHIKQ